MPEKKVKGKAKVEGKVKPLKIMKYDPVEGGLQPHPPQGDAYRRFHGNKAWLINPWTGKARDPLDIGSDPLGSGIVPPEDKEPLQPGFFILSEALAELEEADCRLLVRGKVDIVDADGKIYGTLDNALEFYNFIEGLQIGKAL